jgi:hypothetical protein
MRPRRAALLRRFVAPPIHPFVFYFELVSMMGSTDEQQWLESGWNGASVLQEAPHLRQLLPTLDGSRHDALREM